MDENRVDQLKLDKSHSDNDCRAIFDELYTNIQIGWIKATLDRESFKCTGVRLSLYKHPGVRTSCVITNSSLQMRYIIHILNNQKNYRNFYYYFQMNYFKKLN